MQREQLLKTLAARMWALLEAHHAGAFGSHELYVRRNTIWLEASNAGLVRDLTCLLTSQRTDRAVEREQWAQEWGNRGGGVHGLVAA